MELSMATTNPAANTAKMFCLIDGKIISVSSLGSKLFEQEYRSSKTAKRIYKKVKT
jgi:hypothetical protein